MPRSQIRGTTTLILNDFYPTHCPSPQHQWHSASSLDSARQGDPDPRALFCSRIYNSSSHGHHTELRGYLLPGRVGWEHLECNYWKFKSTGLETWQRQHRQITQGLQGTSVTGINQMSSREPANARQMSTHSFANAPLSRGVWTAWISSSFLVFPPSQDENHAKCSAILNTVENEITFDDESWSSIFNISKDTEMWKRIRNFLSFFQIPTL